MKSIAFFNNKGGVGKTTLLCNLAAHLCKKQNMKVLVVDADPQCNTTTYVLDEEQFYNVYYVDKPQMFTVSDLIPPLEDGSGYINSYEAISSPFFGFDVIPGHPRFAACEDFLASEWRDVKSSDLRGIKSTMLFFHFLSLCNNYDYVFFDMGPSLGAINRSILLACDCFVTPMSSDVFSLLALGNIGQSITQWGAVFNKGLNELDQTKKESISSFKSDCSIRFLGYVEQQYITKSASGVAQAVRAYDEILKKIPDEIRSKIVDPINRGIELDYKIGSVPNFYSLVPMSQTAHKPIFSLTNPDGVVGAHYQKVKDYDTLMEQISHNMIKNLEAVYDNQLA